MAAGQIVITEIMYDLDGTDTAREWVEIENIGTTSVDITDWRFADVKADGTISKHLLYPPPDNGGVGTMTIAPGSFAVLAADAATFLRERAGFSGIVIDTTISNFGQQNGRTYYAKLFDKGGTEVSSMSYTIDMGASGDGNSLQKVSGAWVAGAPTPGAPNVSGGAQTGGQPAATTTSNQSPSTSETAQSSSVSSSFPTEPQISAELKGPQNGIAGADIVFSGIALGLQKQPIENARFLWTFGDGASREGKSVIHSYFSPGQYVVVLNVSSEKYTASVRQTMTIIAPSISVQAVEIGPNGFVELYNGATVELDLSNWHIRTTSKVFTFPIHTIILSRKPLRFSNQITGLEPNGTAELLYPNGVVSASYTPKPSVIVSAPAKAETKESPAPAPKPAATVITPAKESALGEDFDSAQISKNEMTASALSGAQRAGSGTQGTWVWYLLLGGVIVVASIAYWIGGRREEGEFRIVEDVDNS